MIRLSKRMPVELMMEVPESEADYVEKKTEESGNITYIYDEKHVKKRNRQKAKKVERLEKSISDLRDQVREDLKSDDIEKKLAAIAVGLIDDTYERVGNEESAESGHYGVTTWKVKHVTFSKGKAKVKYVGKSGVDQSKEVTQKSLVTALKDIVKDKNKDDRIFEMDDYTLSAGDVNKYLKKFKVTAKDIRGFHANTEMRKALKSKRRGTLPKDEKEKTKKLKEEFKKALEETAEKVGHEPGTLKNQYLVPTIEENFMLGKLSEFKLSKRMVVAQDLEPKAPGAQILIEPYDTAVAKALSRLPANLKNNITKIIVHPEGGPGQLGHVEMGPGKDPREVHVFKSRINEQVRRMFGSTQPTPVQLEQATEQALIETLIHEGVHIGPEKTQEQVLDPAHRFRDEPGTEMETKRHMTGLFPNVAADASIKLNAVREKYFPFEPMTEPDLEFTVCCALDRNYDMVKKGIELIKDPVVKPVVLEIQAAIDFNKKALANKRVGRVVGVLDSTCTSEMDVFKLACWQAKNQLKPTGKLDKDTIAKLGKMLIVSEFPRNFGIVVPKQLYRGGMIDNINQVKALKELGIKRIVSLHNNPEISRMCEELGLEHLPAPIETGAEEEYGRKILGQRVSDMLLEKPTYVHCWFGADRTGGVIARFRTETGWTNKDAYLEAKAYGFKDMFADLIDWFSEAGEGPPPVDTRQIRIMLKKRRHHPYKNPEVTEQCAFTPAGTPTDEPFRGIHETFPRYERWSDTMRNVNPVMTMTPPAPTGVTGY